jgi:hypothetical protein
MKVLSISRTTLSGWILYLAGKDGDLLDNPSRLGLQELLNDVVAEGTSPNDGEFCVSRHELTLSAVCVKRQLRPSILYLHYLCHPHDVMLVKIIGSSAGYPWKMGMGIQFKVATRYLR